MKILPWVIIVFLVYVIYYFIKRYEKKVNELEKRLKNNEESIDELKKKITTNRLLIEENKFNIQENIGNTKAILE